MGHTGGLINPRLEQSRLFKYWWATLASKEGAVSKKMPRSPFIFFSLNASNCNNEEETPMRWRERSEKQFFSGHEKHLFSRSFQLSVCLHVRLSNLPTFNKCSFYPYYYYLLLQFLLLTRRPASCQPI